MNLKTLIILVFLVFIILVTLDYFLANFPKKNLNIKVLEITIHNPTECTLFVPYQQKIRVNGSIMEKYKINTDGSNVFFFTNLSNPNESILFSWFAGYYGNEAIWWVKLTDKIPPNGNITIYMYIGSPEDNYYKSYYPYVGISSFVYNNYSWGPKSQYDNGKFVFTFYGWFYETLDGWYGLIKHGSYNVTPTNKGVEMIGNTINQGSYIMPYNTGNISIAPIIVEEGWFYDGEADAHTISLFGESFFGRSRAVFASGVNKLGGSTPALYGSVFVQYEYYNLSPRIYISYIGSNNSLQLYEGPFIINKTSNYLYTYFAIDFCDNDSKVYASTGYFLLDNIPPISLLGTLDSNYRVSVEFDRKMLSGNHFAIGAGSGLESTSLQSVFWIVGRTHPPRGIMPEVYFREIR